MKEIMKEIKDNMKCVLKRIEIPVSSPFDERDPRSPAIRPDPVPVRTVAEILKELRNGPPNLKENNLGIRI